MDMVQTGLHAKRRRRAGNFQGEPSVLLFVEHRFQDRSSCIAEVGTKRDGFCSGVPIDDVRTAQGIQGLVPLITVRRQIGESSWCAGQDGRVCRKALPCSHIASLASQCVCVSTQRASIAAPFNS